MSAGPVIPDRVQAVLSVVVLLVVLALVSAAGSSQPAGDDGSRLVPRCPEDSTLVGTGAYSAGRWTAYACGPAVDDWTVTP